jgi:hypothetical protein
MLPAVIEPNRSRLSVTPLYPDSHGLLTDDHGLRGPTRIQQARWGQVEFTVGSVTAVTKVTITATLPSDSVSSVLQIDLPETIVSVSLKAWAVGNFTAASGAQQTLTEFNP